LDKSDAGYEPYTIRTEYVYDPNTLNLLEEHRYGAASGPTPGEETHTYTVYSNNMSLWIYSSPTDIKTTDSLAGNIVSRKWIDYYDETTGNLKLEETCISETPASGCLSRNSAQNAIAEYQYFPEGNVQTITVRNNPLNQTTAFTYDTTKVFPFEMTNAVGHVTRTEFFTDIGKVHKITPPHLQGTSFYIENLYDEFGRLQQENRPDGGYTSYGYTINAIPDGSQQISKQEHIANGAAVQDPYTVSFIDGLGRSYSAYSSASSGITIYQHVIFDNLGRVAQQSNPYYSTDSPHYTTNTYDGLSRIIGIASPDNKHVLTSYCGLTTVVTDQNGHTITAVKDTLGRVKTIQDHNGTIISYIYNPLSTQTITAQGNPEQKTITVTYDSAGRKKSMSDPYMGTWTYIYDKVGNLWSQTDAKAQTITFDYDTVNRVQHKYYPDHTVTYTYDNPSINYSKGMLTSVSDPSGGEVKSDIVQAVDVLQRITQSQKNIGTTSATMTSSFDSVGRIFTQTYLPPNGFPSKTFRYVYDIAGNLTDLQDVNGARDIVQYRDFTALGQYRRATLPKLGNQSVTTDYTYDAITGRLANLLTRKNVNGSPVATYQNLAYQDYDGKGRINIINDIQNNIVHTYTRDNLDRLISSVGTGTNPYNLSYQYDRIGNITRMSDFNAAPVIGERTNFEYDNNGNTTRKYRTVNGVVGEDIHIAYNADNMPSRINKNGSDYIVYTYDGNGARVRKQNLWTGNSVLYFGEVYELRGTVGIMHLFAGPNRIVSIRSDGTEQCYHSNHLGSASVITDANGDMKEKIEYYPFGAYRDRPDYDASFPNVNYTFTGQEDDDETGLMNYGARLYDPAIGRFISPDTIIPNPYDLQSYNRYSYVLNDPVHYTDPSGHYNLPWEQEEMLPCLNSGTFSEAEQAWLWQRLPHLMGNPDYSALYCDTNFILHNLNVNAYLNGNDDVDYILYPTTGGQQPQPPPPGINPGINLGINPGSNPGSTTTTFEGDGLNIVVNVVTEPLPRTSYFDGILGRIMWILNMGNHDGLKYDKDGNHIGLAPIMGYPPDVALPGGMGAIKFTGKMVSRAEKMYEGKDIRKVLELVEKFGGEVKNWKKMKTWDELGREIHYYYNKVVGRRGTKFAGQPDPF
jgi:RHS repeat-associated protein